MNKIKLTTLSNSMPGKKEQKEICLKDMKKKVLCRRIRMIECGKKKKQKQRKNNDKREEEEKEKQRQRKLERISTRETREEKRMNDRKK